MNTQRIVVRNIILLLLLALFVFGTFSFLRWLYKPTYIGAYNDSDKHRENMLKYSGNIFTHIINFAAPVINLSYVSVYGYGVPGAFESIYNTVSENNSIDLTDPKTYFGLVSAAFSQDFNNAIEANNISEVNALPDIRNFEDAPEGAIYFSEEDEYTAEGLEQTTTKTPEELAEEEARKKAEEQHEELLAPPDKLVLGKKSPEILIYHTHGTESYMPNTDLNFHTLNSKYSVISVGDLMARTLHDKYKYNVIHDKTLHDKESYVASYVNSNLTVKSSINKYKSLKVILDVHRDAFDIKNMNREQQNARKNDYTVEINGKKAAKVMLVIGQGNPNYPELEKFAVYIKKKMDKLYPGLFLKIERQKRVKYNQYFSNYSMLIEIGCMLNTHEEAKYSAQLMANVVGEVLKDLQE